MSLIETGSIIPNFSLPDPHGNLVQRTDYRAKAGLLVLFMPTNDEQNAAYLAALNNATAHWRREQKALVIVSQPLFVAPNVTILVDADHKTAAQFLPAEAAGGWFITDRYGELYAQGVATTTSELPKPHEFTEWMDYVGMRCGG